jgi:competence protein ComFC
MPSLLDFVFPKKCVNCGKIGEYFCRSCISKVEFLEKPICPICQRQAIGGRTHPKCMNKYSLDGLVVACKYRGVIKKAIQKVKYKWIYDIGENLVDVLSGEINKFDIPKKVILVPVPLHSRRKNWRGFNQAEILAKNLAKKFKVDYADIMNRFINTKTQVGLSKADRKKNVKNAFSIRGFTPIKGHDVILVDDVYTSGATMVECAKILKKSGAKSVWGMAVALG